MSPEILKDVNQAVKAALEHAEETGNQGKRGKKWKYNTSFTPEDRAVMLSSIALSLDSQYGFYSIIHICLTAQSKPVLRYELE